MMDWKDYFFEIAKTASIRSNCIRAKVGAVVVDENNHIKSTGYNGTPHKVLSCKEAGVCYRIINNIPSGTMYETCRSIHAEQNAIIQAGADRCQNATIFVYGHDQICILCKRFIIQSGIIHIYIKKNEESPFAYYTRDDLIDSLEKDIAAQSGNMIKS